MFDLQIVTDLRHLPCLLPVICLTRIINLRLIQQDMAKCLISNIKIAKSIKLIDSTHRREHVLDICLL